MFWQTSTIFVQEDLSSDDFQTQGMSADKLNTDGRYQWDNATEDKICDLYEQYIEVRSSEIICTARVGITIVTNIPSNHLGNGWT